MVRSATQVSEGSVRAKSHGVMIVRVRGEDYQAGRAGHVTCVHQNHDDKECGGFVCVQ